MKTSFLFTALALSLFLFLVSCSVEVDSSQSIKNTAEVVFVGENGTISPRGAIYVPIDSVVSPAVTPEAGYSFKQWDVSVNIEIVGSPTNPGSSLRIKGDGTVTALFEKTRPVLTIVKPEHGSISLAPGAYSYEYGTTVNLTATADTGWQFSSWTGATGNASTSIVMDGSKTITATFIEIPAVAGVVYVWKGATTGSNTGTNWANAYTNLNTALTSAAAGATIWVAQGVFSPEDASTSFTPKTNTLLYGGFNGFETSLSDRKFSEHFTELNGSTNNTIMKLTATGITVGGFIFSNSSSYGIQINTAATNSIVEDCIFKNIGTTAVSIQSGATVANRANTIRRCIFHSNNGTSASGKAINIGSLVRSTLIENSVFVNNAGPAITDLNSYRSADSATNIINCTIVYNVSTTSAPGGIRSVGNARIRGCIVYFNDNTSKTGMQIDSTWIVEDCDIQDNATTKGILRRDAAGFANNNNLDVNPLFTFSGGTLPTDREWYLTTSDLYFIPKEASLYTANFLSQKPIYDIRKKTRGTPFDIGAYEIP